MVSQQDKTSDKVRIKDSYRERIFSESQRLGKSYLETLYFIIDCYFAFIPSVPIDPKTSSTEPRESPVVEPTLIPDKPQVQSVDSEESFTLDWDL